MPHVCGVCTHTRDARAFSDAPCDRGVLAWARAVLYSPAAAPPFPVCKVRVCVVAHQPLPCALPNCIAGLSFPGQPTCLSAVLDEAASSQDDIIIVRVRG